MAAMQKTVLVQSLTTPTHPWVVGHTQFERQTARAERAGSQVQSRKTKYEFFDSRRARAAWTVNFGPPLDMI